MILLSIVFGFISDNLTPPFITIADDIALNPETSSGIPFPRKFIRRSRLWAFNSQQRQSSAPASMLSRSENDFGKYWQSQFRNCLIPPSLPIFRNRSCQSAGVSFAAGRKNRVSALFSEKVSARAPEIFKAQGPENPLCVKSISPVSTTFFLPFPGEYLPPDNFC